MAITVLQSSASSKSLTQLIGSQADETDVISAVKQRVAGYDGPERAREDLIQIGEVSGKHAFAHGGILKRIRDERWYKAFDCPYFGRFLDEQGLARSTAYAHIQLYERITESGVCWGDVQSVGWTKLRYLASQLNETNREAWIKLASEHTVAELRKILKGQDPEKIIAAPEAGMSTQVDTGCAEPLPVMQSAKHNLSFSLHEDQRETVEAALENAKSQTGSPYDNVALEMICLSFLAEHHQAFGDSHFFRVAVKHAGCEKLIHLIRDIWPDLETSLEGYEPPSG